MSNFIRKMQRAADGADRRHPKRQRGDALTNNRKNTLGRAHYFQQVVNKHGIPTGKVIKHALNG